MMEAAVMRLHRGVTRYFRSRWPEWCLAAILLGQALQLLSAREIASNRVYRVLASMVHESTLASVAFSLSITWLVALVLNGTFVAFRRVSPWVRAVVALVSAGYWGVWSIMLYQATGPVTSVSYINHAGLSAMALLCFLMSAREVAVADERAASCRNRPKTG